MVLGRTSGEIIEMSYFYRTMVMQEHAGGIVE